MPFMMVWAAFLARRASASSVPAGHGSCSVGSNLSANASGFWVIRNGGIERSAALSA